MTNYHLRYIHPAEFTDLATSIFKTLDQLCKEGQKVGLLQRMRIFKREIERFVVIKKVSL